MSILVCSCIIETKVVFPRESYDNRTKIMLYGVGTIVSGLSGRRTRRERRGGGTVLKNPRKEGKRIFRENPAIESIKDVRKGQEDTI